MAESNQVPWQVVEGGRGREIPVFADLDRLIEESAPEDRPALVIQLAARLAQLGAGLASTSAPGAGVSTDGNISVGEAARRLGISSQWIYRHADRLPFVRKIGRRVVCSAQAVTKWSDRQGR